MENILKVKLTRPGAKLPNRATQGSAGYDLCACIDAPQTLEPGGHTVVPTGVAIALLPNNAAYIFARSGLAVKHGIVPANAVGVIDSDYRGEILVGLINQYAEPYTIQPGERIAQLVIMPVLLPQIIAADELPDTQRGAGGFGSTGRSLVDFGR
ncbi:MAG: dUTP diphosphatase [Oscillospiraceae bacterium]|nr:dUTP diphosphatase [Oscillospiraceae bacterium]